MKRFLASLIVLLLVAFSEGPGNSYYVSCTGNDSNPGTARLPWKTLSKANAADLLPGDKLLFRRGCVWEGTLNASWSGSETAPITIGAYKTGPLPIIRNSATDVADAFHIDVKVTGSWLIIENIATSLLNPPVDPGCENNPEGWYIGFNFVGTASNNVLRYVEATKLTAGVHMQKSTYNNQVLNSFFTNNHAMERLTPIPVGATDDIGAWGILLKGSNHVISRNYFADNNAWCTFDTNPQGNSVELYEAKNNVISYNIAVGDRVFSELGSSSSVVSDNNTYAYNLVISSILDGKFITTRGPGADFGPVYDTILYNNTIYLTGPDSQTVNCGFCGPNILTSRNNIYWAEWKAFYADAQFNESNNIYWSSDGSPYIQGFTIDLSSKKINPQFVDPVNGDFHLKATSPAIDKGMWVGWILDLDSVLVPQGTAVDIGAYEFVP